MDLTCINFVLTHSFSRDNLNLVGINYSFSRGILNLVGTYRNVLPVSINITF